MTIQNDQLMVKINKVMKASLNDTASGFGMTVNKFVKYAAFYIQEHAGDHGFVESFYKSVRAFNDAETAMQSMYESSIKKKAEGISSPKMDHIMEKLEEAKNA